MIIVETPTLLGVFRLFFPMNNIDSCKMSWLEIRMSGDSSPAAVGYENCAGP
jgi:hypothetical protein